MNTTDQIIGELKSLMSQYTLPKVFTGSSLITNNHKFQNIYKIS